ncbi:hypothetical protein AMATHDRAFT_7276 [Amanita thiersii Skay4041]|uniref:Uncharacterized protein n=1 Tax=Amanita thiersii Skay4041 TaxID=703135 RepID=A0A2A9NGW8_9AGAR|nr:hypothetical protein AMATHDRAFT_7276 [Amanita thiersii Skay4041]
MAQLRHDEVTLVKVSTDLNKVQAVFFANFSDIASIELEYAGLALLKRIQVSSRLFGQRIAIFRGQQEVAVRKQDAIVKITSQITGNLRNGCITVCKKGLKMKKGITRTRGWNTASWLGLVLPIEFNY